VQATQGLDSSGCDVRNTLRPVWWFVLPWVLIDVLRGSLPAFIYPGG
jgi:hypothetical protein